VKSTARGADSASPRSSPTYLAAPCQCATGEPGPVPAVVPVDTFHDDRTRPNHVRIDA
jgi:hypothetical protein